MSATPCCAATFGTYATAAEPPTPLKDLFDASDVEALIADSTRPCVTLYMATHPALSKPQDDSLRFRNLLSLTQQRLVRLGLAADTARNFLAPARALRNDAPYWEEREKGFALFISPNTFRHYRLPLSFPERVHINSRFFIRPLLPLFASRKSFWVLTLQRPQVRLFAAEAEELEERHTIPLPPHLVQALAPLSRLDSEQADYPDSLQQELLPFLRQIDAGIRSLVRRRPAPLLLAGEAPLLTLFQQLSHCDPLRAPYLEYHAGPLSQQQLQQQVARCRAAEVRHDQQLAAEQIREAIGVGQAADEIGPILLAANQGRIKTLLLEKRSAVWGRWYPSHGVYATHPQRQPEDEDLLDRAAAETLAHEGEVYTVDQRDMPTARPVAALFHY